MFDRYTVWCGCCIVVLLFVGLVVYTSLYYGTTNYCPVHVYHWNNWSSLGLLWARLIPGSQHSYLYNFRSFKGIANSRSFVFVRNILQARLPIIPRPTARWINVKYYKYILPYRNTNWTWTWTWFSIIFIIYINQYIALILLINTRSTHRV